ncbi:MAG: hypothetical protein GWN16_04740, partial [Calditrichae bacterium]|nr:hypothetical protein [Calditrichia bacterium]
MKKFLFILTFIAQAFLCGCSFGGVKETDEKNPSLEVLKQAFKGNYKINKRDKGVSFMYCPDNTCEKLFAPRPFKNKEFFDFAVMYFYFSSGYSYLDMDLYGKPSPINV